MLGGTSIIFYMLQNKKFNICQNSQDIAFPAYVLEKPQKSTGNYMH